MKQKVLFTISLVLAFLMLVSAAGSAFTNVPVKKISLNETSLTISEGQTFELKATISPDNATKKTLIWSSSNKKIITVDKNGKIKALKTGKVNIIVKSPDGKISSKCSITVTKKEPVKLALWGGVPEESGPKLLADAYNNLQKEVKVEYVRFVNDDAGNTKLDTALMAGDGIDLFVTYHRHRLVMRAKNGSSADLSELIKKFDYDYKNDVGDLADFTKVDGKVYAIASTVQPKCYVVNKKMFDEAGIPIPKEWTIEEYRGIAKKLAKGSGDNKVYGSFIFDADWYKWLNPAYTKLGGDLLWKKDGTSGFDLPEIKTALQLYYDMSLVDGSIPPLAETISKKLSPQVMFLTGKAAMSDAQWILRYIKDTATYPHDFVTVFVPFPKIDKNQSEYYCPGGNGDSVSIVARSKNQEEAMKFLLWYQKEGVLNMAKFGRIPASKSISKEAISKIMLEGVGNLFDKESFERVFLGTMFNNKYALQLETKAAPEIATIVKEEGEKALVKSISVDEAINNMKKRADEALKNAQ